MAEANAVSCLDPNKTYNLDFNGNTPAIGEVWLVYNRKGVPVNCVTITSLIDVPGSELYLQTLKTDCQTCYESNLDGYHFIYRAKACFGRFRSDFYLDPTTFGILPTNESTYFIQFDSELGSGENCFVVFQPIVSNSAEYLQLLNAGLILFTTSTPIEYPNCESCLSGNTNYYEVVDCATGDVVVLNFPIGYSPCGQLFTYTDGIDQYCGNGSKLCNRLEPPQSPIGDFVADLGKYGPGNDCENCLSGVAETRIITNCLTGEVDVVWNSLLNQVGDASNLSSRDGCFEIGPITSATPTISGFLNFDPQPDCQDCIQCNGVNYLLIDCNTDTGYNISSFDYHPIGTIVYNPFSDTCCTIVSISPGLDYDITYSLQTYSDCPSCDSALRERWVFDYCYRTNSGYYDGIVVTNQGLSSGDVVNLQVGNTDFLCVKLDTTISGTYSGYDAFKTNTSLPYDSCSACTSDSTYVGVTLLNCADQTYGYYRLLISDYEEMIGFGPGIGSPCISNSNGYCYTLVNTCAITPETSYPIFTPSSKYFNCTICQQNEYPNVARSANTETLICNYCCDCGASGETITQIVPPHPIWSDGYNTPVTQMNMVLIGSGNGLNG